MEKNNGENFVLFFKIFVFVCVVVLLILAPKSHASAAFNQEVTDTYSTNVFTYSGTNAVQYLGTGISGTLGNLSLYMRKGGSGCNGINPWIWEYSQEPNFNNRLQYRVNAWEFVVSNQTPSTSAGWLDWDFSSSNINFDSSKYYVIFMYGAHGDCEVYGSSNNTVLGGNARYQNPGDQDQWLLDDSIGDFAFKMTGLTGPGGGGPSSNIQLLTPTTSTASDFRKWEVSYTNATTTPGKTRIIVWYTSTTTPIYGDTSILTTATSSNSMMITKNRALELGQPWSAYAELYIQPDSNPETPISIASSTIVSFTLTNPSGSSIYGGSYPTSTATSTSITCDPSMNAFSYSLCYLFQYLFYPSTDVTSIYSDTYDEIKTKPPFGYIEEISNIFNNFSTSTTSTIQFADLSNLSSFFDPIKNIVSAILWVLFGFWVFHKFRNIEL